MKNIFIVSIFFLFGLGCQNSNQPDPQTNLVFNQYLDRKFDEMLHRNPEFASSLGYKYNYGSWSDRSHENYHKEVKIQEDILDSLNKFPKSKLDSQSLMSLKLYEKETNNAKESLKWEGYQYDLNQMGGVVTDMPAFLINVHQIDSLADAQAYISRLSTFNIPFNQSIENLKFSQAKGIIPPAFTFPFVSGSIQGFIKNLADPNHNDFITDFQSKIEKLNLPIDKKKELINQAKKQIAEVVLPSYKKMDTFWSYLQTQSKTNHGAWALPNGDAYYKYCLKYNTTLDLEPEEVYNIGLKEVSRIQDEMRVIMKKVNYKNDSLLDFFNYVRNDPKFQYSNDEKGRKELLADATRYFTQTEAKLPELFNILPKAKCIVMPVEKFREKSAGGAFYENPSIDGKRPGRYYVNLYNMKDNPKYQLEALTAHEAIPGHHMQIAIAQELTGIPMFRKFYGNTAYIEGWALYAEKLNKELGFYTDPYSDFGRLSMELFRAARLVLDVGIHHKKWTKEQAIEYFTKNTANAEGDIRAEVERYFLWPGQATGYKIGMNKILELREQSKGKLKDQFDIRKFHDIVLKNGAVPLDVLSELVNNSN